MRRDEAAVIHRDKSYTFSDMLNRVSQWRARLAEHGFRPGEVVSVVGDYSADSLAAVLALIENRNIVAPVTRHYEPHFEEYWDISQTSRVVDIGDGEYRISDRPADPRTVILLPELIDAGRPGLVLFTSGSTGKPKGVVHDFDKLLSKFETADKRFTTLCFLMFDHIAGIDTYLYCLFSGGAAVLPDSRNPGYICGLIEKYGVEVLPTSPTFLNLLSLSEEYENFDLSSLKIITFGSETMPDYLLKRVIEIFPSVKVVQKYGVTELGSPPSKSDKADPSWIKLDSENFKVKIIDNIMYVKAKTAMLGYLNAPQPFTEDGWFCTGDAVEVHGEFIKILGRESDIINVGGEKVYPSEVENVILQMDNVLDVAVFGVKNPLIGNMVCAKVQLVEDEPLRDFTGKLKAFCRDRLEPYKIPVKISLVSEDQHSPRFKKLRKQ